MAGACPCFGRNANCRMCNGCGIVSSDWEEKAINLKVPKKFDGQSESQKAVDAETILANARAANAPKKNTLTAEQERANVESRENSARLRVQTEAHARCTTYEETVAYLREAESAAIEKRDRDARINAENLRIRKLKAELEKNLPSILEKKQKAAILGEVIKGPYRCTRCQWINESADSACYLCHATNRYIELSIENTIISRVENS